MGLGFTEEMAQELRNSTEELDFQDPTDIEVKQKRRKLHQQQAVSTYNRLRAVATAGALPGAPGWMQGWREMCEKNDVDEKI